jgi:hypothetical protein
MSGFDNFVHILMKPDNLPIAGMVLALGFLLRVWWRQAAANDRLIRDGRRDEVGREMRK